VVLFAVNIFFTQRIVRALQPRIGWNPALRQAALYLLLSVPAVIILNMASLIVSFFSVGNLNRLQTTEALLKFGSSWNTMLAVLPIAAIFIATSLPGPRPEKFGTGMLRIKIKLVIFIALLLSIGAAIPLYAVVNPERPDTASVIFGKTVFYTTGFMLEIIVVALLAVGRVDQMFHIPNGSSKAGDYSKSFMPGAYGFTAEEIEQMIHRMEVPHQIMRVIPQAGIGLGSGLCFEQLMVVFYARRRARPEEGSG
jgi:hypothetical protein